MTNVTACVPAPLSQISPPGATTTRRAAEETDGIGRGSSWARFFARTAYDVPLADDEAFVCRGSPGRSLGRDRG